MKYGQEILRGDSHSATLLLCVRNFSDEFVPYTLIKEGIAEIIKGFDAP